MESLPSRSWYSLQITGPLGMGGGLESSGVEETEQQGRSALIHYMALKEGWRRPMRSPQFLPPEVMLTACWPKV